MPAKAPSTSLHAANELARLGQRIRLQRRSLGLSASTAAEAAAMSRVTFHRIEAGEPSVTMGAYMNAIAALGMAFEAMVPGPQTSESASESAEDAFPASIALADYPELKRLAWHARGLSELTPQEAFNIYERNGRHLDVQGMNEGERKLLQALINHLGRGHLLV